MHYFTNVSLLFLNQHRISDLLIPILTYLKTKKKKNFKGGVQTKSAGIRREIFSDFSEILFTASQDHKELRSL